MKKKSQTLHYVHCPIFPSAFLIFVSHSQSFDLLPFLTLSYRVGAGGKLQYKRAGGTREAPVLISSLESLRPNMELTAVIILNSEKQGRWGGRVAGRNTRSSTV